MHIPCSEPHLSVSLSERIDIKVKELRQQKKNHDLLSKEEERFYIDLAQR